MAIQADGKIIVAGYSNQDATGFDFALARYDGSAGGGDTPPETSIESGPAGATSDSTPTFTFSSSEVGSTFECRVDAASFAPCSSPHTTAALTDGQHTFEVRAIDAAGNVDQTPASRAFTVDSVAPQTTVDSGPSGPTNASTPTFGFSSSEVGSSFECRVDGAAFAACTSPHTSAALGEGQHTFEVRATDAAGNVDQTPASRAFTVDTTAPQTTIDSGPSGTTNDSTPTFGFSSSEVGSSFECRVDAAAFASCTSPHTTAALGEGPHTFEVRATDAAGNADRSPAGRMFTVSSAAPPDGGGGSGQPGGGGSGQPGGGGSGQPGGGGSGQPGGGGSGQPGGGGSGPPGGGSAGQPVDKPSIGGPSFAGTVRVSSTGVLTLPEQTVDCTGPGRDCAVRTSASGGVPARGASASARRRRVKLGGSSFQVKAGNTGEVKLKLTRKALRLLKRLKRIKATVTITVRRGAKSVRKTVKVTLRAAKRRPRARSKRSGGGGPGGYAPG